MYIYIYVYCTCSCIYKYKHMNMFIQETLRPELACAAGGLVSPSVWGWRVAPPHRSHNQLHAFLVRELVSCLGWWIDPWRLPARRWVTGLLNESLICFHKWTSQSVSWMNVLNCFINESHNLFHAWGSQFISKTLYTLLGEVVHEPLKPVSFGFMCFMSFISFVSFDLDLRPSSIPACQGHHTLKPCMLYVCLSVPWCSCLRMMASPSSGSPSAVQLSPPTWNAWTWLYPHEMNEWMNKLGYSCRDTIWNINLFGRLALLVHGALVDLHLYLHGGAHEEVWVSGIMSMQRPDLASRVLGTHSCISLSHSQPNCMASANIPAMFTDVYI